MSFAVWITGLPASGKSTITAAVRPKLEALGFRVEVLESDAVRRILTPAPTYSRDERELFYRSLAFMGSRLVVHGVVVLFDATATKRAYRDFARSLIDRFVEVAVECPLEVCMARDQKGTYAKGLSGQSLTVPGLQDPYEISISPDIRIDTVSTPASEAAQNIIAVLVAKGLVSRGAL
jgi:adenylylsulfate kinase